MKLYVSKKELETFRQRCYEHNLKMTPQRIAIYEAITDNTEHPSADAIFRKLQKTFPTISFDTVNRTLATFAQIGLLHVVEGHGDSKRFDPNLAKHHHFRCVKCGAIIDFYNDAYDTITIPHALRKRFTVSTIKVLLEGVCAECHTKRT